MTIFRMFPPEETPNHLESLSRLNAEIEFFEEVLGQLYSNYQMHWNAWNVQLYANDNADQMSDWQGASKETRAAAVNCCDGRNLHLTVFNALLHLPIHYQKLIRTAYGIDTHPARECCRDETLQDEDVGTVLDINPAIAGARLTLALDYLSATPRWRKVVADFYDVLISGEPPTCGAGRLIYESIHGRQEFDCQ